MVEFSERLQELRSIKGVTWQHVADKAGISPGYMSKIKSGTVPPPLDLLPVFSEAMHLSDSEFQGLEQLAYAEHAPRRVLEIIRSSEAVQSEMMRLLMAYYRQFGPLENPEDHGSLRTVLDLSPEGSPLDTGD